MKNTKKYVIHFIFLLFLTLFIFSTKTTSQNELPISTYTSTTETSCLQGQCTTAIYPQVEFVEETQGNWKHLKEAKSIKKAYKLQTIPDEKFNITIEDYNLTSFKNICFVSSITGNIPLNITRYNYTRINNSIVNLNKTAIAEIKVLIPNPQPNVKRCYNFTLLKSISEYEINFGI